MRIRIGLVRMEHLRVLTARELTGGKIAHRGLDCQRIYSPLHGEDEGKGVAEGGGE